MKSKITVLRGEKPGLTAVVMSGVHGDEMFGVEAMYASIPPKIDSGTIYFVEANPEALKEGRRFLDTDLNRAFNKEECDSREWRLAQELKMILDKADVLLDIHGSFVPDSKPFLIGEDNSLIVMSKLPIDLIVSGFDEFQPGGTDYYMNKIGKMGICAECGYAKDPSAKERAVRVISEFLKSVGAVKRPWTAVEKKRATLTSMYVTDNEFKLKEPFKDFTELKEGEVIGWDGDTEVRADCDGFILFAASRKGEAFVYGKKTPTPFDVGAMLSLATTRGR